MGNYPGERNSQDMPLLVNVASPPRSGSTMLDLILGNAQDAFSCGEVYAWFRPFRTHHFKIDCSCGKPFCPIWEKIKRVPESQFHATVAKELGVNYVIDSSKDLCWLVDVQGWAAEQNMKVVNLLLWKNPADLAYSYLKRGLSLAYWRRSFVGYYSRVFETGIPFLAVNYNDLVADPQRKVAEVSASIGMSYFAGKERFWEKEHHYLFGSGGIRKQTDAGVSSIMNVGINQSDAFNNHIQSIKEQVESDSELQRILKTLRKYDISTSSPGAGVISPMPLRKPYPLWYLGKKVVATFRRYFPEQFVNTQL